ncbi:MAG: hypothetical protein J1F11_09960 [Oscillospiraceae bacterium]|nr:hypothetical protein [Oscillospiraceae bacterium]
MPFCIPSLTPAALMSGWFDPFRESRYYPKMHIADSTIRYAVSGDDEKLFENISGLFFSETEPSLGLIMRIIIILYSRKKYRMLEVFIDAFRETSCGDHRDFERDKSNSIGMADLRRYMDQVQKYVFDKDIPDDEGYDEPFLKGHAYIAMITDNVEGFRKYVGGASVTRNMQYFLMSAITFENTEILKILFENEAELALDMEQTAFLCTDDKAVKYLGSNFPEQITGSPEKREDITVQEFITNVVDEENMIEFAVNLMETVGPDRFKEIFSKLPPVRHFDECDIKFVSDPVYKDIFADTLSCNVMTGGYLFDDPDDVPKNVLYDFTNANYDWLKDTDPSKMLKFFKFHKTRFPSDALDLVCKGMLIHDHEKLTAYLISEKLINRSNLDEVIDYLCEKKCITALNVINLSEIPEAEKAEKAKETKKRTSVKKARP